VFKQSSKDSCLDQEESLYWKKRSLGVYGAGAGSGKRLYQKEKGVCSALRLILKSSISEIRSKIATFLYYSGYSCYRMTTTTIQVSRETKAAIGTFGSKEDTYDQILKRMYDLAVKEQLREFLLSSENTITLAEARKRHAERWHK